MFTYFFFFFNDTATTEIYTVSDTLSLHDALPILSTRILGIESSCDETAAAVVADGREILSSVVASQIDIHRKYGGVVPELASREHLRQIVPVVREALAQAGMKLTDVDAIGVTQGPGLVGALLVGITYGKTLAQALSKPLVPVNHLEGHVHAVFLEAHKAGRTGRLPAGCRGERCAGAREVRDDEDEGERSRFQFQRAQDGSVVSRSRKWRVRRRN